MSRLRTYLFAVFTFSYLLAVSGIPVYLHYCGGELEEISYLSKVNSCCGAEEEEEDESSDCCHNESLVLRSTPDVRVSAEARLASLPGTMCYFVLFTINVPVDESVVLQTEKISHSPPLLQQTHIIETSCMRI